MAKTKTKYKPNTLRTLRFLMYLIRGDQTQNERVMEVSVQQEQVAFDDINRECLEFVKSVGFTQQINMYTIDPDNEGQKIGIYPGFEIKVQDIVENFNSNLIILIRSAYEELKQDLQSQIYDLKRQLTDFREIIEQLRPLKDNIEFLKKNSYNATPLMIPGYSSVEREIENLELDIGILFSEPLYNDIKNKPTLPAVDFKSEIQRINMALKSANKASIIIRSEIATKQSLKSIIKLSKPKILHIICHGDSEGFLEFEQDSKNTLGLLQLMEPKQLGEMLQNSINLLPDLVFVNSCHSQKIGSAFFEIGVKNVIMINSADLISDEAAQIFSQYFYRNIFKTESLLNCYEGAKKKVGQKQIGGCCCNHSSLEPHRENCRWVQIKKRYPKAHKDYHVPSVKCLCQLKYLNRHNINCEWAKKVLFEINADYRIPIQGTQDFRFPQLISEFPDYFDRQKKELVVCCCPEKGRRPHSESNKFLFLSRLTEQQKKQPFFKGPSRYSPQITDLTPFWLMEAHQKCKTILGRQKELFQFLKLFKQINLMVIYGKSGTGLTSFTIKASTYMMERRVFEYFFFIDLYGIKDSIVFRYKFNEVTKFQYDGNKINKMFVKKENVLIFLDNCDDFLIRTPDQFYQEISTLLKQVPKCKIIITFKQETLKYFDEKRTFCKKFQLNPLDSRFAIAYLNSKLKDKTDLGVGYEEYQKLIQINSALKIPKVVESLSQSFPDTGKKISFETLKLRVKEIQVTDTNKLIEQVLNQLKEKSFEAFQFLIFVSQFADGIYFKDLQTFSLYVSDIMPVKKNWRDHFEMLLQKQMSVDQGMQNQIEKEEPKLRQTVSEMQIPSFAEDFPNLRFQKHESDTGTVSSQKQENKNKNRESYFLQKNQNGKFIVKRFIRDYVWNKYSNETTYQMKFIYVAYFSVILEMLFQILKTQKYVYEELRTYSAISESGIFSFSTKLKDTYEEKSLTKSGRFGKDFKDQLNSMFVQNSEMLERMKKTDPPTFIMNHKHDFLKIYDNDWKNLYEHLAKRNKGQEKVFLVVFQNLMVYIPTALKIAKAEEGLIKYVLRGSSREVEKFETISQPERSLIIQLKIIVINLGMSLVNREQKVEHFIKGNHILQNFRLKNSGRINSSWLNLVKNIFVEEQATIKLIDDLDNLVFNNTKDILSYLDNKKQEFLRFAKSEQTKELALIKMKQAIILSETILKFLTENAETKIYRKANLNKNDNIKKYIEICKTAVQFFFKREGCMKLYLRSEIDLIQLLWEFSDKFQLKGVQYDEIDNLRLKLNECEQIYLSSSNKLKGFPEFGFKIQRLKQEIKGKLWKSSSKRIIFLKSYPLATKEHYPIIKNLVRKKNNFRNEIKNVLTETIKQIPSQKKLSGFNSPALKPKDSGQKKITLDISTKYQILTSKKKIIEETDAKCSLMFLSVDVKVIGDKIYFISQNKLMQQQLIQIDEDLANHFNSSNMVILVLSGVNTKKAMKRINEFSQDPPIIIALHSDLPASFYQFGDSYQFDHETIREIVKRQNEIKLSEITYTQQFIKSVTQTIITDNEKVRKIHEQAEKKMKDEKDCRGVRCYIETKGCKNVNLQYSKGQYRDLSPGYSRNHNMDQKYYDDNVVIRRWQKMPEFFDFLKLDQQDQMSSSFTVEKQNMSMSSSVFLDQSITSDYSSTSYINIFGETGCGKTSFIREVAKILVERESYDCGVYLFDGKKIQNNFAGDFEDYIRKQSNDNKIPALEQFESLLGERTILMVDDFHLIKQRQNARMKMFLDKILSKKVNLILISVNELKLDFLPKINKIKLDILDNFETEVLAYNIININNTEQIKAYRDLKYRSQQRKISLKVTDIESCRKGKYQSLIPSSHLIEDRLEINMKKASTTFG